MDRDTKFTRSFRAILLSGRVEPLALPSCSPNLNAYAERWVRSVKEECLSKVILFGERSLRRALSVYVEDGMVSHPSYSRVHEAQELGSAGGTRPRTMCGLRAERGGFAPVTRKAASNPTRQARRFKELAKCVGADELPEGFADAVHKLAAAGPVCRKPLKARPRSRALDGAGLMAPVKKRASHAQQGEDDLVLEADGAHAERRIEIVSCRRLVPQHSDYDSLAVSG